MCVCRCDRVRQSLSAKGVELLCPLYAIHWGDWVAHAATGHTRKLSLAAGGVYTVCINKHAQTYVWTVFSSIYMHIFQLSRVEVHYTMTLNTGPPSCSAREAGTACVPECSVDAPVLSVWPAMYMCVYIAYRVSRVSCLLLTHSQPCCWRDQPFNQTRRK